MVSEYRFHELLNRTVLHGKEPKSNNKARRHDVSKTWDRRIECSNRRAFGSPECGRIRCNWVLAQSINGVIQYIVIGPVRLALLGWYLILVLLVGSSELMMNFASIYITYSPHRRGKGLGYQTWRRQITPCNKKNLFLEHLECKTMKIGYFSLVRKEMRYNWLRNKSSGRGGGDFVPDYLHNSHTIEGTGHR